MSGAPSLGCRSQLRCEFCVLRFQQLCDRVRDGDPAASADALEIAASAVPGWQKTHMLGHPARLFAAEAAGPLWRPASLRLARRPATALTTMQAALPSWALGQTPTSFADSWSRTRTPQVSQMPLFACRSEAAPTGSHPLLEPLARSS